MNVMTKLDLLNKDARQRLEQYLEPDMTSLLADDMSHDQQPVPFHKLNHALATLVPTISSIIPLLHSITPSLHWYVSSAQSHPCCTQSRPRYAGVCHQLKHTLVTLVRIICLQSNTPDTRSRNRRQKTGVGFWSVCHTIWRQIFLAPDSGVG